MSKIIVDQIQSSNGDTLNIPINDGEKNNILTTDGEGNLEFKSLDINDSKIQSNIYGINIPSKEVLIQNPTETITVGDTTNYCATSGCSCIWTVPVGATEAEFQVWGAGGNGNGCGSQCCTWGIMGGNGEYTYVKMKVQEGDTYTLCAGGAYGVGGCYSYCDCDGCNSFVCGSNNTCIMSCGGTNGYQKGCWGSGGQIYPNWHKTLCGNQNPIPCTSALMYGSNFTQPASRYNGECGFGCYSSSNKILSSGKVPSMVGYYQKCDATAYSAVCVTAGVIVTQDHNLCSPSHSGVYQVGRCYDGCATYNKPGMGGPGWSNVCNCAGTTGGRGRSGQVIVKYK
ncbi:MAG: hypothetical protein U9R03_04535 [Candidatus Aerophobetes bacterium]|nr:hypothetical protein [Candidatus Aerophobetes bacterium]